MMDIQHPDITRIEKNGFLYSERRNDFGVDGMGNEVFLGETILVFDGEFYLVEGLFQETIEILEQHGATHEIAK